MKAWKPCPFCGATAKEFTIDDGKVGIECSNPACLIQPITPAYTRICYAARVWNKRKSDEGGSSS